MKKCNLTCSHPDFKYAVTDGACPVVMIFSRQMYKTPTEEQLNEYRRNKKIVEDHGGVMKLSENEFPGLNSAFTSSDVKEMIEISLRENPQCRFIDSWNGEGCYTFSIGLIVLDDENNSLLDAFTGVRSDG